MGMMTDRKQRDKEQTIQDVLNAAIRLFSERGLHGTSVRDVEKASGISKGLIMHHFGTKENLYRAVQDHLNQAYVTWMAEQRRAGGDLPEVIESGIRSALSYLQGNRDFQRIMLWSYLEGQRSDIDHDQRFTAGLIETMRAGQEQGAVRDDISAAVLPFIIMGAIDYWIRSAALREAFQDGIVGDAGDADEVLVDTLTKMMLKP